MDTLSRLVAVAWHLEVPWFLIAQALGMVVATWLVARRLALPSGVGRLLALAVPLGAVLGSIALGVLLAAPGLLAGRESSRRGLLMAFGGLGGAAIGALVAGRAARVSPARSLDAVAPSLGVLVLFGRIGCWLAGCCFGVISDAGVRYPAGSPCWSEHLRRGWIATDATVSLPVVPVQLGEVALGALMVVVGLTWPPSSRRGSAFAVVLGLYAAGRFALEGLRGDVRPIAGALSVAQWLAVAGLSMVVVRWPRRSSAPA